MHQQTYCHTLLQPFFKIFLFRIYAPTIHSIPTPYRLHFVETSDRLPHISAPIQPPQTNPPTTQSTHHKYHHTHSTNTTTIQPPQTHTASTPTQTHTTQGRPDVDAVDALDVDADAQTLLQHRCSRSPIPVRNSTGRADRIRLDPLTSLPDWTEPDRQDQIEPDKTGLDQTKSGIRQPITRQAAYRIRPYKIRPDRIRPGQVVGFAFDETSRPVSANFFVKPDSTLLRNASRAGAVVGVDVV